MSLTIKCVDLFCGCGGMSLGFEASGFNIVAGIDNWKAAIRVYEKNFDHPIIEKDLMDVEGAAELIAGYTPGLIIGGPPCQDFSTAGFQDESRGRAILSICYSQIVSLVRPKYFVMENVPNLLTAESGFFKNEITELFNGLGYSLTPGVLNAADYGIPQNRRRAVIIGKLNGGAPALPLTLSEKVTVWDAIEDLAFLASGEGTEEQAYRTAPKSAYAKRLRGNCEVLSNHVATRHSKLALERLAIIPPNSGKEVLPKEHLTKSIYSGTWTRMGKDEVSVTITTRFDTPSSGKFTHPYLDRAITVREAARIQSFPDDFVFTGTKSSQMKQVGNAVPPLLAEAIADTIMADIKNGGTTNGKAE